MNIKDIAKLANVSISTVSRVINKSANVNEEKRKKVLEIIERENYIPNHTARDLIKSSNYTIGIVVPNIYNSFFAEMVNEIILEAEKRNIKVILCITQGDLLKEIKYVKMLLGYRVKGMILIPSQNKIIDNSYIKILENIPFIQLDRKIDNKFSGIYIDNNNMIKLALQKNYE